MIKHIKVTLKRLPLTDNYEVVCLQNAITIDVNGKDFGVNDILKPSEAEILTNRAYCTVVVKQTN